MDRAFGAGWCQTIAVGIDGEDGTLRMLLANLPHCDVVAPTIGGTGKAAFDESGAEADDTAAAGSVSERRRLEKAIDSPMKKTGTNR